MLTAAYPSPARLTARRPLPQGERQNRGEWLLFNFISELNKKPGGHRGHTKCNGIAARKTLVYQYPSTTRHLFAVNSSR